MREFWPQSENVVRVSGGSMSALILPDRGGKIVSLLDARGKEWMAPPDREVGRPARPGDDFLSSEMCGWDECAPTIVACSVNGIPLADHGELWTKAFSVKGENMTALDSTLGYEFSRRIQSTSDGLIMDYRVRAGQNDVPFLWAGHPQFRAPSGTRVLLPSSVKRVVDVMDLELPILDWSNEQGSIDTVEEGGYRKIYAHPDEFVSNAILMHSDGSALELAWTSACSFLGLWFDKFAFRKEAIIAIEPTTGYFDSLETAIKNRRVTNIAKGTELSWQIRIRSLA